MEGEPSALKKRKKKKSFLQKAKKFGKRGRFGQGQDVDRETYNYFVQVLDTFEKEDFDDEEAKELFVANTFASNEENEEKNCCNQLASRVIEKLLPIASLEIRTRLMEKLGSDLRRYASNPFASHIIETLLLLASFQQNEKEAVSDSNKKWVFKVAKYSINNFDDFAYDPYASHVLRTSFQCLCGSKLSEDMMKSKRSRGQQNVTKSKNAVEVLTKTSVFKDDDREEVESIFQLALSKVEMTENISELCSNETSSGVLQSLLLAMSKKCPKLCKKFGKLLKDKVFYEKEDTMFDYEAVARLLEVLIMVSGSQESMAKIFNHIYEVLFKGNLVEYAGHPVANFSVQKLLQHCPTKEMFESWYEEKLDENVDKFMESSQTGVVLAIAQASRRLAAKQNHFLVALMKALGCNDGEEKQNKFFLLLIKLLTLDKFEDGTPVSLHGALLAQEILHFNKPIKLVNSILNTDPVKLAKILSDPRGSHVTDAFMASSTIGEKSRESLIKLLQDELVTLACSKHGSRSLDAIWSKSSPKCREILVSRLVKHETRLNSDQYGKFIAINFGIATFKRSKDQWKASFDKKEKTKKMFNEFLAPSKEKKKLDKQEKEVTDETESVNNFFIDDIGDKNLLDNDKPPPKKKAKSYLDDL